MVLNFGELNEIKFVEYLNNKKFSELNPMFQNFIEDLFGKVDNNDIIISKNNIYPTKTDIFIKINNKQKRISIKMGYNNSIHIEPISSFIHFLIENQIKKEYIYKILLSKINNYSTGVHFSSLFCQPQDRCLNHNVKYENKRFCIQIKWYSLFDDIIENMNNNIVQ